MTKVQEENYERDHSHIHCFQSKKPPCGQKIEHLKCCLCEILNPKALQQAYTNLLTKLREKGFTG